MNRCDNGMGLAGYDVQGMTMARPQGATHGMTDRTA